MKKVCEMNDLAEVDRLIDQIERDMPNLHERALRATSEERAADSKLNAMCEALERKQFLSEIASGNRCANGDVNYRV